MPRPPGPGHGAAGLAALVPDLSTGEVQEDVFERRLVDVDGLPVAGLGMGDA